MHTLALQYCKATRKKVQCSVIFKINVTIITSMRKFTQAHAVSVYYKQNNT